MRKSVLSAIALAVIALASFPAAAFGGKKSITGHVQIYGNAPFTFVGFVTESGEKYSLDIAPEAEFTIQDIKNEQGNRLKLTGFVNEKELLGFQTLEDGRFVVMKYKILK